MKKWKTLSSKPAFTNKWFNVQKDVVQMSNGEIIDDYHYWMEPNVSQVVGVTNNKKLVLVKQYKHAAGEVMIEYPAGYLEANEDFESAARREYLEETGYKIREMVLLGKATHNPTKSSGIVKFYLAENIQKVSEGKFDENEDIEIMELDLDEVIKLISSGKIWATGTIAATFLAVNRLNSKL